MTELPDDELDKLFRKSSEELDPQFDPEDWNRLRRRLDANDGKVPGGWLRKWWPLGLLALLIPIGFALYFTNKTQESATLPITDGQSKSEIVADIKASDDVTTSNFDKTDLNKNEVRTGEKNPESPEKLPERAILSTKPLRNKEADIAKSSSVANLNITDYQRSKKLPRSQSKTGGVYLEPNRSKQEGGDGAFSVNGIANDGLPERIVTNNAPNEQVKEQPISEEQARTLISVTRLASRTLNWENQPEIPAVTFDAPENVVEPAETEKVVEDYAKWAVRLGYSPDLTTVGFKNYTKPGTAFSLLIEYGLSSRLYLQSGVIWSRKDYYAYAKDYELKDYVTYYNTPYGVDGECTMIEVPLGLRYNFIHKAQSKLFIGTGVSSYYAQKEQYKYHYAKYVPKQKEGWDGKTGWFLLSHINASVGYERTITNKFSLVAEPYIRIPVKGVGYGKVNLTTVGMWISLRYTPAFK
ncbi:hypothetical protein [Dyadobacter chenhuakuii]|uniref:Outer membrane protein with beta-barrel domain n=1 Tax=Dyadobacter chenhuakuii TaxID=2909339 RepID=A0ABY4XGG7_9BACT|nr:hypothetical protein [Dyadobacter chenhuakuii]MCF2495493.1 hypothetical protein [Dyadobacter chenhuakuii]USJ29530.1 hypothetical protein NFI80_16780 [Dyadobacter chenhuakuii]